ncbi:MAG: hypothetical protein K6U02_02405 [Firmicutes bacterium]|nr:hypothetical protein [Bacillota bacterium]
MGTIRNWSLRLWLILCIAATPAVAAQTEEIVRFGGEITVPVDETVSDVVCLQCSVRVLGRVAGDMVTLRGDVDIEGRVDGDVVALFGNLRLGSEAEIGGDTVVIFGRLEREIGARTEGEVVAFGQTLAGTGLFGIVVFAWLAGLALLFLLCLLCYAVLGERRTDTMATALRERAAVAWLVGIGVLVSIIVLSIVAKFLGPAKPILVLVALGLLFVTALVGYTGAGYWVGRGVAKGAGPVAALLLGLLVIHLLQASPFAGFLAGLFFGPLALGVAALTGFGTAPDWLPRQLAGRGISPTGHVPPPPAGS